MRKYKNDEGKTALEIASDIHASTNHTYYDYPYSLHLMFVCKTIERYFEYFNFKNEKIFNVLLASGAYHDLIEDCRITYWDLHNDKKIILLQSYDPNHKSYMDLGSRELLVDIVYACTELRGKTREERHGHKYMNGIYNTPFAWFVKMADIIANTNFSKMTNNKMLDKYREEVPNFIRDVYGACSAKEHFEEDAFYMMITELEGIIEQSIKI